MDDLASLKKRLKTWEGSFAQKHGRKPGKDDITEAGLEIKDLYKKYYSMKKTTSTGFEFSRKQSRNENSENDENVNIKPPSEDVWGVHLNKSRKTEPFEKPGTQKEKEKDNNASFMKNLGKKLLANASQSTSKVEKRGWGLKKPAFDSTDCHKTKFSTTQPPIAVKNAKFGAAKSSENSTDNDVDNIEVTSSVFALGLKIAKKQKERNIESFSQFSSSEDKLDTFVSQLQNRKNAALKLQNKYKNICLDNLEGSVEKQSESTFSGSILSEENNAMSSFAEAKQTESSSLSTKPKISPDVKSKSNNFSKTGHLIDELSEPPFPISQNNYTPVPIPDGSSVNKLFLKTVQVPSILKSGSSEPITIKTKEASGKSDESEISPQRKFKEVSNFSKSEQEISYSHSQVKPENIPKNRIAHTRKRKASENDDWHGNSPKKRNVRSKMDRDSLDSHNDSSDSMFIDVGWRPSSKQEQPMIELDGDSMLGTDNDSMFNDTGEMEQNDAHNEDDDIVASPGAKKKSTRKREPVASKVSNDNFVRLNMKVKKYVRRGGGRSGSAHKRFMWKQKMKARSESFGASKCFKCGQEGHWAKKCKGIAKGKAPSSFDASKAEDNTVDDADFPTLNQAFNMARGIKLDQTKAKSSPKAIKAAQSVTLGSGGADLLPPTSEDNEGSEDEDPEVIRTAFESLPPPPPMEPLYECSENGALPEIPSDVYKALGKFGYSEFRQGQEKAIMRVLCGMSTLVVLSTGAGKSLCYQLPAYMYAQRSKCITLVISPLVSLMEDQVSDLPPGIKGACLHTNMSKGQREKIIESVTNGDIHFLLISPEALVGGGTKGFLQGVRDIPPIAFACIDEAHCLSEWSHHFRPSYLRICKILKEKYGVQCILGLTATATMVTAASVSKHLGIQDYGAATIRGLPVPENLYLSASRDENRDDALITLLQGDRFAKCNSIIVYCTRREETDRIATLIRTCLKDIQTEPVADDLAPETCTKKGKGRPKKPKKPTKPKSAGDAECYHAGLSAAQRKRVQNAFMSGRLRIVVATVAFGMGLDKSDVRGVIHYNLPKSFESYVQEIGRAGRDGLPAHCHLFLDPRKQDMQELKRHIYSNTVDRFTIKKLVRRVFPPCRCRELHDKHSKAKDEEYDCSEDWEDVGKEKTVHSTKRICPGHERTISIESTVQLLDMREEGIATLLCYLELHSKRWIENLQNVYGTCTIQCYGGPMQLQQIAKKCPPVAVAIAQQRKCGISHAKSNKLEFSVVDVSDSMGWESGPVKRELKMLQWAFGVSGPQKTGVMVEFTDLCFHLRSPGDLTDEEVDSIVEFLSERMETQESTELRQLQNFHDILHKVSHNNVLMCSEKVDEARSTKLKSNIFDYFEEQPELDHGEITMLSFAREKGPQEAPLIHAQVKCDDEDYVRGDIRGFIQLYSSEHQLNGRAIARIFHGIPSPCFPAEVWGRVRRFWRSHLHVDFNSLRKLATVELVKMR